MIFNYNALFGSLRRQVAHLETKAAKPQNIFFTLVAIIICRNQLELWFEDTNAIVISLDMHVILQDYIHVFCAWVYVYLTFVLLLQLVANKTPEVAFKVGLYAMLIILIPPIFDGLFNTSGKIIYQYDFSTFTHSFIHLLNPWQDISYVTTGVRIEIGIAVIICSCYLILSPPKNYLVVRMVLLIVAIYLAIYIMGYLPAIWSTFTQLTHPQMLNASVLQVTSTTSPTFWYIPLLIGLVIANLSRSSNPYWIIIKSLLRPDRMLPYLSFMLMGFLISADDALIGNDWLNPYDAMLLLCAVISISCAFMAMTALNDYCDRAIDKISNPDRPSVKSLKFNRRYPPIVTIMCLISLSLSLLISPYHVVLIAFMLSIGYVYSVPPFRLRRFLFVAPSLLTLIFISCYIFGSAIVWGNQVKFHINTSLLLGVAALFWLGCQYKDFKDVTGDKLNGVMTVPILLGQKMAYCVLGGMTLLVSSFLLYRGVVEVNIYSLITVIMLAASLFIFPNGERLIKAMLTCFIFLGLSYVY